MNMKKNQYFAPVAEVISLASRGTAIMVTSGNGNLQDYDYEEIDPGAIFSLKLDDVIQL